METSAAQSITCKSLDRECLKAVYKLFDTLEAFNMTEVTETAIRTFVFGDGKLFGEAECCEKRMCEALKWLKSCSQLT